MNQLLQPFLLGIARLFTVFLLIGLFGCKSETQPRKVEVLFLGHQSEHHNSEAYLPMLASALAKKGINFTYTDEVDALNEANLQKYDGLALYANHDSITTGQERALLNFVKSGKGFIPIHCASYCFRNSAEFVKMVGAQFKSHGKGTFTTDLVLPDHPAIAGLQPFETWDETYVHDLHTDDRTILMERKEGEHVEPWTWVKTYGKGRVFYTAYGHDERTWSNPGFHTLMEKGILWAVGDELKENLAQLQFPSLQYSEAKIPNYEKRDPPPQLQAPLSPEESQSLIQIPPDFELQLFASEPDINQPVAMAWDEKGRLWLLETTDYPNEINVEDGKGNDQIKIIEDTDNDGKADKFTVFADELSVPTSMVFANGGVIVAQAPHFLFLKDTDGDDKADVRETIITGWGTYDTHAGPSNLKYGFDNWIWGTVGYSSFNGKVGADSLKFRQGIYRFRPDGSELEFMGSTSNNTWGLGFSETFDVFASTANNTHSAYLGIPDRYLANVTGLTNSNVKKIDGHYFFHPITPNVRQVDVFGGFTAAAGHNLYTARSFPKEYWNRIAFVCEPTGHLLHRAILEKDGAGFKEKDGWNMLASADEWVSPVHAEVGPDGALWILDWYNFIIQHNPTPKGFETGKGNAHVNPLRDKKHGRIYRLAYKKAPTYRPIQLSLEDKDGLIAALKSDNMLWRMQAQRLLLERGELDVLPELFAIIEDKKVDEIGLAGPAVHALWTIHGLGALDGNHQKALQVAENALQHPAAGVRKAAIQVLPKDESAYGRLMAAGSFQDTDPHTRLAAILSLGDLSTSEEIGTALFQLSQDNSIYEDAWLAQAVYVIAVKHQNNFIKAVNTADPDFLAKATTAGDQTFDWLDPDLDLSAFPKAPTPSLWDDTGQEDLYRFDGVVWFYRSIDLTAEQANQDATLSLGAINDSDQTYVNGQLVGTKERAWREKRIYTVRKNVLKPGENVIQVRAEDTGGTGGFTGEANEVYLQLGAERLELAGEWPFKVEEIYRREKSVFSDGKTILDVFLENYGPYAKELAARLADDQELTPADQTITIKALPNLMKYDLEEFTVQAGTTIEILFENTDAMQHNLLILEPGTLNLVGALADKMATTAEGPGKGYVPEVSQVLASSILIDPGTTSRLRFQVPDQPGDYPFVCTFPGHWRTMNGVMKVEKKKGL